MKVSVISAAVISALASVANAQSCYNGRGFCADKNTVNCKLMGGYWLAGYCPKGVDYQCCVDVS